MCSSLGELHLAQADMLLGCLEVFMEDLVDEITGGQEQCCGRTSRVGELHCRVGGRGCSSVAMMRMV